MSSKGINSYSHQLTAEQIASGEHRAFVGGMWDTIGRLQLDFLTAQGLTPSHRLIDVGCGALRGGVHFIRYLNTSNYYGIDINSSLITAAMQELANENILDKKPTLLVNDAFEFSKFGQKFDFALAVSVFTHLPMNHILRSMKEVRNVLSPSGKFFASFFEAPHPGHISQLTHNPGETTTNLDSDPYHYSFDELNMLAKFAGLQATFIGDWSHPRAQKMLMFTPEPA